MILFKQHLQPTVSTINDHKTESLWLDIQVNNGDLLLGVCYRPEVAGIDSVANLGFLFGGGGGGSKYFGKVGVFAWREATRLLGGSGACSPEKI